MVYAPAYYSSAVRKCFRTEAEAEAWLAAERHAARYDFAAWADLERLSLVAVPVEAPPGGPPETG